MKCEGLNTLWGPMHKPLSHHIVEEIKLRDCRTNIRLKCKFIIATFCYINRNAWIIKLRLTFKNRHLQNSWTSRAKRGKENEYILHLYATLQILGWKFYVLTQSIRLWYEHKRVYLLMKNPYVEVKHFHSLVRNNFALFDLIQEFQTHRFLSITESSISLI